MQKDLNAKLTAVEASLKRWHTRLTRAANMLQKLEKQRRRLLLTPKSTPTPAPEQKAPESVAVEHAMFTIPAKESAMGKSDDKLDLPTFLDRRKVKVDKKAMPLTGKAALDYIKPKRKAKA